MSKRWDFWSQWLENLCICVYFFHTCTSFIAIVHPHTTTDTLIKVHLVFSPPFKKQFHILFYSISLYYPRNNISPRNTSFVVCQTYKCLLIGGLLSILKNKQGGYLWKAVLTMFVVYCIHILHNSFQLFWGKMFYRIER